jgi:Glycosyltransferase family 87
VAPSLAGAQGEGTAGYQPPVVTVPSTLPVTPAGYGVDASAAINRANANSTIEELRRRLGPLSAVPTATRDHWEIAYTQNGKPVGLAFVDPRTGAVTQAWTGPQVVWPMARGYSGQFGHILNAPYVWIPLALIFFFGLFDWRRPGRIAHLDLLFLLSFGVSQVFFNHSEIGVSAPLAYIPLVYLLGRVLWIGFRAGRTGLRPSAPITWLVVGLVFLCGFRIAINVADSGVIDVGYAGVIGADRIERGDAIYGDHAFPPDDAHGDTYGPINYAAYVPFELALPWSGHWDSLPSAHAAAIFFDLAAIAGLFVLGGRLRPGRRGRDLGVLLAFAWAAYPFTDLALQSNSNDSLVAALLIWGLVAFSSVGWRALLIALAAGAKFTPLFLVPLFATGYQGLTRRLTSGVRVRILYFAAVFASVGALLLVYPAVDPGLATTWERTIQSQLDRSSPFSIWGQVSWLQPLQTALLIATVAFAAALALVPRRRTLVQVAALSAAVIIATQLTLEHWFYLYIPWFFGMLMAAIAPDSALERPSKPAAALDRSAAVGRTIGAATSTR